ncbi:hypothetical protein BsWGS_27300 [Bradybaena similaris]
MECCTEMHCSQPTFRRWHLIDDFICCHSFETGNTTSRGWGNRFNSQVRSLEADHLVWIFTTVWIASTNLEFRLRERSSSWCRGYSISTPSLPTDAEGCGC